MSPQEQQLLEDKAKRAILSTLQVDGHKYDKQKLQTWSNTFCKVCAALPDIKPDRVCSQLRISFFVAQGRSFSESDVRDIALFNELLQERSILELRDEAAYFVLAIGSITYY